MTRRRSPFSRSDVRALWRLLEELGQQPVSIKFGPDGSFHIMTAEHVRIARENDAAQGPNEWDEVFKGG